MVADRTLAGTCHCGALRWSFEGDPGSVTACNCTVCRRYGVLWAYGHEGAGVDGGPAVGLEGVASSYRPGSHIEFLFCPTCGNLAAWRALSPGKTHGRKRMAVNVRLAEPEAVAELPIDRFDGLVTFEDLPPDGRCVADYWA